jgi:hypothetical protein
LSLTGLGALEMTADGAATITELKELCGVCGTVEFVDMRNEEGAAQVRFADASMATKAAGFVQSIRGAKIKVRGSWSVGPGATGAWSDGVRAAWREQPRAVARAFHQGTAAVDAQLPCCSRSLCGGCAQAAVLDGEDETEHWERAKAAKGKGKGKGGKGGKGKGKGKGKGGKGDNDANQGSDGRSYDYAWSTGGHSGGRGKGKGKGK